MARPRTEPAAPSPLVPPLLRLARARGLDAGALAARLGLPAEAADSDEVAVTATELGSLLDRLAEALDEPHLGLLLPGALQLPRYDLPELAARSSATLRQALQRQVAYAGLLGGGVALGLEESGGLARFTHRLVSHPRGVSRHLNEFALASGLHHAQSRTGLPLAAREVHFIHPRPPALQRLQAYFGTRALRFGRPENALVLDSASLDAPQQTADARLLATADSLAQQALRQRPAEGGSFRARVEERARAQLEEGDLRVRRVARDLRMSVRTLQRRLDEEGTTFAEVLDAERERLARALLSRPEPSLSEVSFRLGFSEFATFSRAFKRWTGVAPGAYRAASVPGTE